MPMWNILLIFACPCYHFFVLSWSHVWCHWPARSRAVQLHAWHAQWHPWRRFSRRNHRVDEKWLVNVEYIEFKAEESRLTLTFKVWSLNPTAFFGSIFERLASSELFFFRVRVSILRFKLNTSPIVRQNKNLLRGTVLDWKGTFESTMDHQQASRISSPSWLLLYKLRDHGPWTANAFCRALTRKRRTNADLNYLHITSTASAL